MTITITITVRDIQCWVVLWQLSSVHTSYFFVYLCVNVPVWPLGPLCASPGWSLHAHINLTVKRGGLDLWCCSFKAGQSEQSAAVSTVTCKFRTLLNPWLNCFLSGYNEDLQTTDLE